MCLHDLFPVSLHADQGFGLRDGVTQYNNRRTEECVMGRGGSVPEVKAVGTIVKTNIEGIGLVEVAECGEWAGSVGCWAEAQTARRWDEYKMR